MTSASFVDISAEDALTVFTSALSGEQEAIKRYGIDMSAAAVEQEALATGIKKGTGEFRRRRRRCWLASRSSCVRVPCSPVTSPTRRTRWRTGSASWPLSSRTRRSHSARTAPVGRTGSRRRAGAWLRAFGDLDPVVQSTIGKIAGFGVAGAGLVGTVSLVAGQVIKCARRSPR